MPAYASVCLFIAHQLYWRIMLESSTVFSFRLRFFLTFVSGQTSIWDALVPVEFGFKLQSVLEDVFSQRDCSSPLTITRHLKHKHHAKVPIINNSTTFYPWYRYHAVEIVECFQAKLSWCTFWWYYSTTVTVYSSPKQHCWNRSFIPWWCKCKWKVLCISARAVTRPPETK